MEALLTLFILLQYADGYTTYRILKRDGRELNPILAKLFDQFGWLPSLIVIKVAAIGAGVWLYASQQTEVLIALDAIYAWVVWHNYRQMVKSNP